MCVSKLNDNDVFTDLNGGKMKGTFFRLIFEKNGIIRNFCNKNCYGLYDTSLVTYVSIPLYNFHLNFFCNV